MEEPKMIKQCSNKETHCDTATMHLQCQQQISKLNEQLARSIAEQRNNQLQKSIPSITALSQEISQIQHNLSYEVTSQESKLQRQSMLAQKEHILRTIKQHFKKIEHLKKKLSQLNITFDQRAREYQEHSQQMDSTTQINNTSNINESQFIIKRQYLTQQTSPPKQTLFPSLFAQQARKAKMPTNSKQDVENESKWGRIDKLFMKIDNYPTNSISRLLVTLAKQQNGAIKSVFKNYKTNEKMSQFIKRPQLKRELALLLKLISK